MKRKLILIITALILCASIVGSSLALYYKDATKTISINTGDAITLTLGAGGSSLTIAEYDPDESALTYNLTLDISNDEGKTINGKQGLFKMTAGGLLAPGLNITAKKCTSDAFLDDGAIDVDAAFLTDGVRYELSTTPIYIKVTIDFKDSVTAAEFVSTYAEKGADLSFDWTVVDWAIQTATPYLLGSYGGNANQWAPSPVTKEFVVGTDGNQFQLMGITLQTGDVIKAFKEGGETDIWYSWDTDSESNKAVATFDASHNAVIKADGTYNIYINADGKVYISVVSP